MKKTDAKKQQQLNTLKGELVKRERMIGNKDREINKTNLKLKACEEHIGQLLKIQNRNRTRPAGTGAGTGTGVGTAASPVGVGKVKKNITD